MRPSFSSSANLESPSRILFLDYLRVFAFTSVLVGHKFYGDLIRLVSHPELHSTAKVILSFFLPLFHGGGAGVIVFFMISGYIITSVIQEEKPTDFLVKRCFRIYPLYVLAVVIQNSLNWRQGISFSLRTFLNQLTLFGDFWETPYSLAGVEWTLRVEVLFYLGMALSKKLGFFGRNSRSLPLLGLLGLAFIQLMSPFPSGLFRSYCTTYAPFLILGVFFFAFEKRKISLSYLSLFVAMIFLQYFYNIGKYQPGWLSSHFAVFGFFTFVVAWLENKKIKESRIVSFLSNLTYSCYLFHNWLFDLFERNLLRLGFRPEIAHFGAVLPLLGFCWLVFHLIEKPGIAIGRYFLKRISKQVQDSRESPLLIQIAPPFEPGPNIRDKKI